MIVFPNVLQHRISSFKLADPSQPGHRKLLAMYLVDPHVRILSTAHVPPQQKDWWAEEVRKLDWFERWPLELFDRMIEYVDGFPLSWPEADDIRVELMQERSSMNEAMGEQMENVCLRLPWLSAHCITNIDRKLSTFLHVENMGAVHAWVGILAG